MPAHIFNGFMQNIEPVDLVEISGKIKLIPQVKLLQRTIEHILLFRLRFLKETEKRKLSALVA